MATTAAAPAKVEQRTQNKVHAMPCEEMARLEHERAQVTRDYVMQEDRARMAALVATGRPVAAAADGTLLRDSPTDGLPLVPARGIPGGDRVTDPQASGAIALAGAAPGGRAGRTASPSTQTIRPAVPGRRKVACCADRRFASVSLTRIATAMCVSCLSARLCR